MKRAPTAVKGKTVTQLPVAPAATEIDAAWDRGRPRILVMSHSHPRITRGGAEISAYALFKALQQRGYPAWFAGCSGSGSENRAGATFAQPYGPSEYVYYSNAPFDYFKFANPDPSYPDALEQLLAELKPDFVHLHHYSRFGVETFAIIRRTLPATKILLSLHEYLLICNHNGQMVKTGDLRLCYEETIDACAACFKDKSARDFFLRKRFVMTFLDDVDLFISPSHFLADRYIAWGIPRQKMVMLENLPSALSGERKRAAIFDRDGMSEDGVIEPRELRIGFFGQMSPLKGIVVLIEAARRLEKMEIENLVIDIYGDYSSQPPEYQVAVTKALAETGKNVIYHGRYDNSRVHSLMIAMDAIVTPSIWWENSPLVIQEAFAAGKPVICSDIGGMAEKVRHGVDGLHFETGNPGHLAQLLARLARKPSLIDELSQSVQAPLDTDLRLNDYLKIYADLLRSRAI